MRRLGQGTLTEGKTDLLVKIGCFVIKNSIISVLIAASRTVYYKEVKRTYPSRSARIPWLDFVNDVAY